MRRHQNRGDNARPGMSLAECPYCWPGGARRAGGASPVCGLRAETREGARRYCARNGAGREGAHQAAGSGEVLSTVAARAGGPARSSAEARVMRAEQRGRLIWALFARATGAKALGGDE